jgi:hypothetical protein
MGPTATSVSERHLADGVIDHAGRHSLQLLAPRHPSTLRSTTVTSVLLAVRIHVKSDGNDDYTVDCAATYSDGSTVDGYATVELAKHEVLFEPSGYDG